MNAHITGDDQITPFFPDRAIVSFYVEDAAVGGADIFCPLLLHVDQRPLAAAEGKMLQARKLEVFLLLKDHR